MRGQSLATGNYRPPLAPREGFGGLSRPVATGCLLALIWLLATPASGEPPRGGDLPRWGRAIKLTLPVNDEVARAARQFAQQTVARAARQKQWPVLIFEFDVPANQEQNAAASDFSAAYKLADYLSREELNGATTVAFVPKTIRGHAVLVACACEHIIMADDAEIGDAGAEERRLTPTVRSAYKEIADRRRNVPAEVALGMLDKDLEVFEVETELGGKQFMSPAGLAELRKKHTVKAERVVKKAGEVGRFTGKEAWRMGMVAKLARDRLAAARQLELPAEALEEDPSILGGWRPIRVDLRGPLRADRIDKVERAIREAIRTHNVNFVCLWIQSPGGALTDSLRLARYLAFDLDPGKVRTVAYIPSEARADAALVALACDQVIVHPQAVIGGAGAGNADRDEIDQAQVTLHKSIMPRKNRAWSLPAAIANPRLDVFRCTAAGQTDFFCDVELGEQPDAQQWKKGPAVTRPNEPFQASGREAVDFRLAHRTADSFQQFKSYFGLEDDPQLMEPNWADQLIEALASPGMGALLLTIAFLAMYVELQSGGLGVAAFVAAVCFLLFFWSRFLGGTAGWLEVMLFLSGLACILLEVFVLPGFGIFGLGGGALILASLVLASQTFVFSHNAYQFAQMERSLWMVGGAVLCVIVAAVALRRFLPKAPVFNKVLLAPPTADEAEAISLRETLVDASSLVGSLGVATTPLAPGGKARFGNRMLDVVADGELLARGDEVIIVEVHGNRIVVQPAKPQS